MMDIHSYFADLPMDTKYYLLDYSREPDKIKEVIGEKAKNSVFFTELMKYIQDTQDKRVADAKQHIAQQQFATDFKPRLDLIQSLTMPFEKRCKVCGVPISAGKYCDKCGKQKAKDNYVQ